MRIVGKFSIPFPSGDDQFTLKMPVGAKVLTVQLQHDRPHFWVDMDLDNPLEERRFRIAGTGHDLGGSNITRYVGTFQWQQVGVNLVFHILEVK